MEISAEKTRLMTNCGTGSGILREIKAKGQNLGTIQASSTSEQLFQMMTPNLRFSQGLHKDYKAEVNLADKNISLGSKVKLMRSLVIPIFLYACDSWTLTAEVEKRNWPLR